MTTSLNGRRATWLICGLLLCFVAGSNVATAESKGLSRHHVCEGDCASCASSKHICGVHCKPREHPCVRAGDPHRIAWYAKPSWNKRDSSGYVGGGATWRGEPRLPDEGTWGLDYAGLFSRNRIWLKWLHGRPSRQKGGSYETDGPHFLKH
jgi:hypothetical protein